MSKTMSQRITARRQMLSVFLCAVLVESQFAYIPSARAVFGCEAAGYSCPDNGDPPPDSCPPPPGSDSGSNDDPVTMEMPASGCSSCGGSAAGHGMAVYHISQPFMNLRIEDFPGVGYLPGIGPAINFKLWYRQRGVVGEQSAIYGVGNNWSFSFRSYVIDKGGGLDWLTSIAAALSTSPTRLVRLKPGMALSSQP
jgi:hypothetical protein